MAEAYTGGTVVDAGFVALAAGASLNSSGALVVNGGQFDLNGHTQRVSDLSGTGGALDMGGGTLTFGTANSTSFGAQIIDGGTLVKQGSGTVTLTGQGGLRQYGDRGGHARILRQYHAAGRHDCR